LEKQFLEPLPNLGAVLELFEGGAFDSHAPIVQDKLGSTGFPLQLKCQ
jgi:hypothetical protein